jgi:hypothetical protein
MIILLFVQIFTFYLHYIERNKYCIEIYRYLYLNIDRYFNYLINYIHIYIYFIMIDIYHIFVGKVGYTQFLS